MTVHDDLAGILNESGNVPEHRRYEFRDKVRRVEAEIARLEQERDESRFLRGLADAGHDNWRARAEAAEAEVERLRDGLRQRERLLRWSLDYIGIDWDESYPDEPPAVTEARSLLADQEPVTRIDMNDLTISPRVQREDGAA